MSLSMVAEVVMTSSLDWMSFDPGTSCQLTATSCQAESGGIAHIIENVHRWTGRKGGREARETDTSVQPFSGSFPLIKAAPVLAVGQKNASRITKGIGNTGQNRHGNRYVTVFGSSCDEKTN